MSPPKKTQPLKRQKVSGLQNLKRFFLFREDPTTPAVNLNNAFLFWHPWKLLHERQFQTVKNEGKRKYSAGKGRTERSADLTGREGVLTKYHQCYRLIGNTVRWVQVTFNPRFLHFALKDLSNLYWLIVGFCSETTDFCCGFCVINWTVAARFSSAPHIVFLLCFIVSFGFFLFASLRLIQHFLWSRRTKTKSSLIIAQIYTRHTWRENAKTSGRHNNNNNKTTTKKKRKEKKSRFCVKHLSSAGEARRRKNKTSLFSTGEHRIQCCTC